MRRIAVALASVLVGCPGGSSPRSTSPAAIADALAGIERSTIEVRPRGPWATHYGGAPNHALSPVESRIADGVGQLGLQLDTGLSKAVRELAALAPEHTNIPAALTDGVLAWAGVVDPAPRLVVVEFAEDPARCGERVSAACDGAIANLVEGVADAASTIPGARFGVGVSRSPNGTTRYMVGVLERAVEIEPVASRLRTRSATEIRLSLLGGRVRPAVEITLPSGEVRSVKPRATANGRYLAPLVCDAGDGAYQVEVLADGAHGVEVAALFPLFCGVGAPAALTVELERLAAAVTPDDVALASLHFLNETRRARGLPLLRWNDRAAVVAEAHSKDMRDSGFVGHVSPTTGDVSARYARAKIASSIVRENVARGYGPSGIHDSLLRSPGHRANMLAADVTEVGIGVVVGAPESDAPGAPRPVFLTQNFHRPPGEGAPAEEKLQPTLRTRIDRARTLAGLPAARWERDLDAIAGELARAKATGRRPPRNWAERVFAAGHSDVAEHQLQSADFDVLGQADLWLQPELHGGFAVARQGRTGFVVVVLVVP